MSKFKKGDWVRVLHTDFEDEFPVGSVAQVHEVDGVVYLMHSSGKLFFYNSELELWQPKVGDRVSVTYGHGWNGEGVVDFVHGGSTNVRMKTGEFAGCVGGFAAVFIEPLPVAAQAQVAAAPLKIEAGRYYRTRDGRRVGPMKTWNDGCGVPYSDRLCEREGDGRYWLIDGTGGSRSSSDLIAEWVDEPAAQPAKPVVAATVDFQADEYGSGVRQEVKAEPKPKFKVGDRVRLINDDYLSGYGVYAGDTGTVVEKSHVPFIKWDLVDDSWCDLQENFELLVPTAIVARIDNGRPKPNPVPFVHSTVASARAEAERLANVHKGQKFGVYVLTGEPACVEREYKFTWQKMAARNDVPAAVNELSRAAGIARSDAHLAVRNWLEAA